MKKTKRSLFSLHLDFSPIFVLKIEPAKIFCTEVKATILKYSSVMNTRGVYFTAILP